MDSLLDRIALIAEKEGVTIVALERAIGASKGVLSRAINNKTDIQAKWLLSVVENYPTYSTRWLLTGKGPMLRDERPAPAVDPTEQAREIALLKERLADKDKIIQISEESKADKDRLIARLESENDRLKHTSKSGATYAVGLGIAPVEE